MRLIRSKQIDIGGVWFGLCLVHVGGQCWFFGDHYTSQQSNKVDNNMVVFR